MNTNKHRFIEEEAQEGKLTDVEAARENWELKNELDLAITYLTSGDEKLIEYWKEQLTKMFQEKNGIISTFEDINSGSKIAKVKKKTNTKILNTLKIWVNNKSTKSRKSIESNESKLEKLTKKFASLRTNFLEESKNIVFDIKAYPEWQRQKASFTKSGVTYNFFTDETCIVNHHSNKLSDIEFWDVFVVEPSIWEKINITKELIKHYKTIIKLMKQWKKFIIFKKGDSERLYFY